MDDDEWEYFFDVFDHLPRGGPGSNATTGKAFRMIENMPEHPRVLDVGCGPGIQTLELARLSGGHITAIDLHQPFLDRLTAEALKLGLRDRVEPLNMDMSRLTFPDNSFDLIWSEGALYSVGVENALKSCHRVLKDGHCLAASEAVLFKGEVPPEVKAFWENEYPDITDIPGCLHRIESAGFEPLSHFRVPKKDWFVHFYDPMKVRLKEVMPKYRLNTKAMTLLGTMEREIELYNRFSDRSGYEFFIMRKR